MLPIEAAPEVRHDIDAPAAIARTADTSGRPKVHGQRNLVLPGGVLAVRGWGPELRKGDSFSLTARHLLVLSTLLTARAGGCAVVMDRRDGAGRAGAGGIESGQAAVVGRLAPRVPVCAAMA